LETDPPKVEVGPPIFLRAIFEGGVENRFLPALDGHIFSEKSLLTGVARVLLKMVKIGCFRAKIAKIASPRRAYFLLKASLGRIFSKIGVRDRFFSSFLLKSDEKIGSGPHFFKKSGPNWLKSKNMPV
jgi:hypothetical protein